MARNRHVVVAGAGIAGLTLALGLAKFGLKVTVLEKKTGIGEFGAGLQISPNARHCLDQLGLGEAVSAVSFEPQGIDVFSGEGAAPVQTLKLGEAIERTFGAPYAVMHRGDLVDVLHAAAKRFANIDILTGVTAFAAEPMAGGVEVRFKDPDGRQTKRSAFAFVGADGVGSATRMEVLGGDRAEYSGKVAWRALAPLSAFSSILDLSRTSLILDSRFHLVAYPLPHRDALNLALFVDEKERDLDALASRTMPSLPARLGTRMGKILKITEGTWTPWVLSSVSLSDWHKGPVGLIGDAAHAMLPFQAQGAAMAIEDAATLAPLLAASPDAGHAFSRLEALRQERVKRVQEISAGNGRIFHLGWPMALARDTVMKAQGPLGHLKRLDWLYGYRIDPQ